MNLFWLLLLVSVSSSFTQGNNERELDSRIIGGEIANPTRYPYFTLLFLNLEDDLLNTCGGSLIAPDVVLTNAACLLPDNATILSIDAFVNYTSTTTSTGYEYERKVITTFPYPKYNPITFEGDIALLFLESAVTQVPFVSLNRHAKTPKNGQTVTVFGIGSTSITDGYSDNLMEVDVSVVSHKDCNDRNSYNGLIVEKAMLCAGDPKGGKDSCAGDNGSPMVVTGMNAKGDVQVGIVSFGKGCGDPDFPGVYTRVSHYSKWIQDKICAHSTMKPSSCRSKKSKAPKVPSQKTKKPTKLKGASTGDA
jgi:transmembrane protease serine 9